MIILLQLIALGVLALVGVSLWNGLKGRHALPPASDGPAIDGKADDLSSPGKRAAALLKAYENERANLKQHYPSLFAMLGGYLNAHTINEHGGVEGAVKEMLEDWRGRSDEAARELTKLLAENDSEEECRAIVTAACDADFEHEGYRKWLTWLLGRFNAL
jgi:hypothetical protein